MASSVFRGTIPALMTPCRPDRTPDFDALVRRAGALVEAGMSAVVYCGSMGDWPLLDDAQRKEGVERLVGAGIPVIVGTGAQSPALINAVGDFYDGLRPAQQAELREMLQKGRERREGRDGRGKD